MATISLRVTGPDKCEECAATLMDQAIVWMPLGGYEIPLAAIDPETGEDSYPWPVILCSPECFKTFQARLS